MAGNVALSEATTITTPDWQPALADDTIILRPVTAADFEAVLAAASDPLIWALHPANDRHEREAFARYFADRLASGGTLVVTDRATGGIIGWSSFGGYDPDQRTVEIGWTFLVRAHWGGDTNARMKALMLAHAFQFVDTVTFRIAATNIRSQRAIEKIGCVWDGTITEFTVNGVALPHRLYTMSREGFAASAISNICQRM